MEDIIYEKDYRNQPETEEDKRRSAILEQAVKGGFFKTYKEEMDKIPKVIVPKDKENYEYLLNRCDEFVQRHRGRIRGIVDYHQWHSEILMYLSFAEFCDPEDLAFLKEISEKAHSVTFEPCEDGGIRVRIFICYFEELMSKDHKAYLQYDAIAQDDALTALLGLPTLTPEQEEVALRINDILKQIEEETDISKETAFIAVLDRMKNDPKEEWTLERMELFLTALLYKLLNGELEEEQ